ncbi:amidohydrolase [Amaricoccus sp.]|uniref:amidohydrolase family protein n=1 Tax=Amaricoccus sp. TaxID=1872485 RepID=UPI001B3E3CF5|nr:amidohydrolase [Amaricoccus sp.]MBP7243396.1 amidohydrolase [Amaricoccus sp.]
MTADLIVKRAMLVTADRNGTVIRDGALAVEGGRIARIGTTAEIGDDARAVVDAGGGLLAPGLVNAHCHAGCSLFRGLVEGLPLEPWLRQVWKAESAILDARTTRLGARLGLAEQLLGGVTCVLDMYWRPRETVAAARDLGMRIATGPIFFDGPGVDGATPEARIADGGRFFAEFAGADDVLPAVLPHGTYTVSPDLLVASRRLADAVGAIWSTHAAETRAEQAEVTARHGRSVIRHLDALGLLDARAVLAHCVWLDDEEIAILAHSGAAVAHNPVSNLKLASGFARVPDMLDAGVRVALGTDGAISGNDLDLWLALRLAATLHKGATLRADAVTAPQALSMVTLDAAAALGANDRIGSLEPGKQADMILLDLRRPSAQPLFDPVTHLVYSAAKSDVTDVWVGGARVVEAGVLTRHDLGETLDEVAALAPRIAASVAA